MFEGNFGNKFFTFELDDWVFTETTAREKLLKHFETKNLKGFGVEHLKKRYHCFRCYPAVSDNDAAYADWSHHFIGTY